MGDPAPAQTMACWRSVRSSRMTSTRGSGNGATAPGANPVASSTSRADATRADSEPAIRATFSGSPRRSPGTSATTGRSPHMRTSDLTICSRAHPTAAAASAAVAAPSANSSMRTSAPVSRRKVETRCTGSGQAATTLEIYPAEEARLQPDPLSRCSRSARKPEEGQAEARPWARHGSSPRRLSSA